jgi:hypothetical protein
MVDTETVKDLSTFIATIISTTPLAAKCTLDVAKAQQTVLYFVQKAMEKTNTQDVAKILKFLKNEELIRQCILPNVTRILADGKVTLEDTPAFLDLVFGIYESISEFVQANPTVTIKANDIVELSALLVKIILTFFVKDDKVLKMTETLLDSAVRLVKLSVQSKSFSCKFCCCKK